VGLSAERELIGFDHSAALCENHLHALYAGANQVMIPAMDFVQHPARFWKALSDHGISYTFAPNFFIAAAVRAFNDLDQIEKQKLGLDFNRLRVIMCGGEANKTATLEAAESILTQHGAPRCSIKASYGLSEVRLFCPLNKALLMFCSDLLGLFL
jgi:acyl-CoA synthetase (AMP-forming)/AMP-acid ligase II